MSARVLNYEDYRSFDHFYNARTENIERDNTIHSHPFLEDDLSYNLKSWYPRKNGIASKLISAFPDEIEKAGYEILHKEDDTFKEQEIKRWFEDKNIDEAIYEGDIVSGTYGGSGLILHFENQGDPRYPFDPIASGELIKIDVVDSFFCVPLSFYENAEPEFYSVQVIRYAAAKNLFYPYFHESNLITMMGGFLPKSNRIDTRGWGYSEIDKVFVELRSLLVAMQTLSALVSKLSRTIHKFKDWNELSPSEKMDSLDQMMEMEKKLSSLGKEVVDSEDEVILLELPYKGIIEAIQVFKDFFVAVSEVPKSIFFDGDGNQLSGNTRESDRASFHDKVDARRKRKRLPVLKKFIDLFCSQKGYNPSDFYVSFSPLKTLTLLEKSEFLNTISDAFGKQIQLGMLAEVEGRNKIKKIMHQLGLPSCFQDVDFNAYFSRFKEEKSSLVLINRQHAESISQPDLVEIKKHKKTKKAEHEL